MFEEANDIGGKGWALGLLGFVRYFQGDLEQAGQIAEKIVPVGRELGDKWALGMSLVLLGSVRLWTGDPDGGHHLLDARRARSSSRSRTAPASSWRSHRWCAPSPPPARSNEAFDMIRADRRPRGRDLRRSGHVRRAAPRRRRPADRRPGHGRAGHGGQALAAGRSTSDFVGRGEELVDRGLIALQRGQVDDAIGVVASRRRVGPQRRRAGPRRVAGSPSRCAARASPPTPSTPRRRINELAAGTYLDHARRRHRRGLRVLPAAAAPRGRAGLRQGHGRWSTAPATASARPSTGSRTATPSTAWATRARPRCWPTHASASQAMGATAHRVGHGVRPGRVGVHNRRSLSRAVAGVADGAGRAPLGAGARRRHHPRPRRRRRTGSSRCARARASRSSASTRSGVRARRLLIAARHGGPVDAAARVRTQPERVLGRTRRRLRPARQPLLARGAGAPGIVTRRARRPPRAATSTASASPTWSSGPRSPRRELTRDEYRAGVDRLRPTRRAGCAPAPSASSASPAGAPPSTARAAAGPVAGGFAGAPAYVMPSTSGLNARTSLDDLAAHLRAASRSRRKPRLRIPTRYCLETRRVS